MNVVVDIGGEIVVDDVGDVGDIQTTSSNSGSNHDGATAATEVVEGTLTLTLSAVTVDSSGRIVLVDEELGQGICHALGLDKDEGETGPEGVEEVKQDGALVNVLDVLDALGDVLRSRTDTSDGQEDVLLQEVAGEHLNVTGESGRKHEGLASGDVGHVLTLDNAANLGLETHVQHAVSLVENEVLDVAERDTSTLDQVDKTSGGSDDQITATLNLAKLGTNVSTTVHHTRTNPRPVGEFAGLLEDLGHQFTGRGQDQGSWVSLSLTAVAELTATALLSWRGGRAGLESLGKDGEEETTSLAGTGLGTGHEITSTHHDGDRILLDGGRDGVVSQGNVRQQMVV